MGNAVVLDRANRALTEGQELSKRGRIEEARFKYFHCIRLYEKFAPGSFGLGLAYSCYAELLRDKRYFEDSKRFALKGLVVLSECAPDSFETAFANSILAGLHYHFQEWDECMISCQTSLSIFDNLKEEQNPLARVVSVLHERAEAAKQASSTQPTGEPAISGDHSVFSLLSHLSYGEVAKGLVSLFWVLGKIIFNALVIYKLLVPRTLATVMRRIIPFFSRKWVSGRRERGGMTLPTSGLGNHTGVLSLLDTTRLLECQGYQMAPSTMLPPDVLNKFGSRQLFDIFLVNAGTEKRDWVSSMQAIFQSKGLECFLDADMESNNGSPQGQMRFALKTCRHAVVVLSKAFFEISRPHPREELAYAFERMLWIRENGPWESMWVVLFDLSVSEYKVSRETLKQQRVILPPLHNKKVLFEWNEAKGRYQTWAQVCHVVKAEILKEDQKGAVQHWENLLKDIPSDFPSPDDLYLENRPCSNFFTSLNFFS